MDIMSTISATSDSVAKSSISQHHMSHHHHHHIRRHRIPSGGEDIEEEELDPRIQIELEKLNRASEEINRLELELDDARAAFRQVLSDSTQRLNGLAKKLGTCVDKARPYYDARMRLREAHLDSQKAAIRYERACSMHEAAKEMVQLAEEGYKRRELELDPTWQEMLNHATMKVNDAERERIESEEFHQKTTLIFKRRDEEVQKLQKDLKRVITKSKPYFEMKAKFNQVMEEHKRAVSHLEEDVSSTKALYSQALRSLEAISDDIHRQRLERRQKLQLGVRGAGVGAEAPPPPPHSWEKGTNIEGTPSCSFLDSDTEELSLSVRRASRGSSDTILDISHHSRGRSQGIISFEPAFRKKASLTDTVLKEGSFKTDPLDVVVFKSPHQDDGHPLFKHGLELQRAQISPYSSDPATFLGHLKNKEFEENENESWPNRKVEGSEEDSGEAAVTPTPTPEKVSEVSSNVTDQPLSESPRKRDSDLSQSSLSRAQEWVNKSPIPQQRRFVKSKSLIDATSSSLVVSSPSDSELSSSLTIEVFNSMLGKEVPKNHRPCVPHVENFSSAPKLSTNMNEIPETNINKLADRNPPSPNLIYQYGRGYDKDTLHEQQSSPLSESPSSNRRSPKLQGLILRVDAAGISSTSMSTSAQSSVGNVLSVASQRNPTVVISTQHPTQGVFLEHSGSPDSVKQTPPQQLASSTSVLPPTTLSAFVRPPTSLIGQHLNRVVGVTKISNYNSKTAPSTLSTSYHLSTSSSLKSPNMHQLTSPTRNSPSPTPPSYTTSFRHQLISPTPLSPPTEKYSISGRSDSIASGSHKSAFLKPPSDSSDTESIASTGPMLDDDQVELINMDFTEQSIAADGEEDHEYGLGSEDLGPLSRKHWSRMSLPPRLSYLEGFLERARLNLSDQKTQHSDWSGERYSSSGQGSNDNNDDRKEIGSAGSSLALSADLEDNVDDFKDDDFDLEEPHQSSSVGTFVGSSLTEAVQQSLAPVACDTLSETTVLVGNVTVEDMVKSSSMEDASPGFEMVDGLSQVVEEGIAEQKAGSAESINLTAVEVITEADVTSSD